MKTIGGGTVRYVGVELVPCPESPAVLGACDRPAQLEVLWRGRAVETFALGAGDALLVADGAEVEPGTQVAEPLMWSRPVRARADGVAHWSEPLLASTDDVTGLARRTFAQTADPDPVLELRGTAGVVASCTVARGAGVLVETGTAVRRGEIVAVIPHYRDDRSMYASGATVRTWLDGGRVSPGPAALVAPCDATVIEIDPRWIVLSSRTGRILRLRRGRRLWLRVAVGEAVRAGDPLTGEERDHRALLHAWGPERLSEHLIDELELVCGRAVPRVYWALAIREMLRGPGLRGFRELARARAASEPRPVGAPAVAVAVAPASAGARDRLGGWSTRGHSAHAA